MDLELGRVPEFIRHEVLEAVNAFSFGVSFAASQVTVGSRRIRVLGRAAPNLGGHHTFLKRSDINVFHSREIAAHRRVWSQVGYPSVTWIGADQPAGLLMSNA